MRKLFVIVLFIFLISFIFAEEIPNYKEKYVNDFANVLGLEQRLYLAQIFGVVEENSTAEITFVSIKECSPLTPQEYATELGEKWGVGKKDTDNGLVILYCFTENKIWVATGYGLEGILPDSKIGRFLDETYVPQKDLGNISEGIILFSEVISNEIILNSEEVRSGNGSDNSLPNTVSLTLFVFFSIFILGFIYFIIKNQKNKSIVYLGIIRVFIGIGLIIFGFILLPIFIGYILIIIGLISLGGGKGGRSSGGFGHSNGGSFSGGGFGGGSFGGGGAGR